MNKNKNIDAIYREGLKEAEISPPKEVWKNISEELAQEQKRKVIPLWFRYAGIAAVLLILITLGINLSGSSTVNENSFVSPIKRTTIFDTIGEVSSNFERSMEHSSVILSAIIAKTTSSTNVEEKQTSLTRPAHERISHIEKIEIQAASPISSMQGNGFSVDQGLEHRLRKVAPSESITAFENSDEPFEEIEDKKNNTTRFQVRTIAGALYNDNLGSGNSLDDQFSNNKGSGEISMLYGINVSYRLSDKIKVRSGIHKMDLSFNTEDIAYHHAISATSIEPTHQTTLLSTPVDGSLQQSLGFIEVPLEFEYGIFQKRLGFNIIAGASTLFLNQNEVLFQAPHSSTSMGEANNLNNVSFSANIGFGVNYQISPQILFSLEPLFKYQINTFNGTSDFRPYNLGIYTGLNYSF